MRVLRLLLPIAALALVATPGATQEWLLNAKASTFYMQTAKANAVIETHQFTGLDGTVSANGEAKLKIDLTSVLSGVDLRDVRMRFLLFETYKYANADITAKLDMAKLQALQQTARVTYPLKFTLNLHGVTKEMEATVNVSRVSDKSVSVVTAKPIIILAETFNLTAGIAKLSEAVAGIPIVPAASFTFDLLFETGDKLPEIQTARAEAVQRKIETETAPISVEACETRFKVISTTGAVYFKTGSAELDASSDPLLVSVVDIANRCPAMRLEVTGHTDNVGNRDANQLLSEQRAKSVANFMTQRGVNASRIVTAGFGGSRPVAPNGNEAGRSKNRRIEFRVLQR